MAIPRSILADHADDVLLFGGLTVLIVGGMVQAVLLTVLGLVVLFAGVFLDDLVEDLLEPESETESTDPLDDLRDRYARGEIDHDEFERRVDGLLETEDESVKSNEVREIERE